MIEAKQKILVFTLSSYTALLHVKPQNREQIFQGWIPHEQCHIQQLLPPSARCEDPVLSWLSHFYSHQDTHTIHLGAGRRNLSFQHLGSTDLHRTGNMEILFNILCLMAAPLLFQGACLFVGTRIWERKTSPCLPLSSGVLSELTLW